MLFSSNEHVLILVEIIRGVKDIYKRNLEIELLNVWFCIEIKLKLLTDYDPDWLSKLLFVNHTFKYKFPVLKTKSAKTKLTWHMKKPTVKFSSVEFCDSSCTFVHGSIVEYKLYCTWTYAYNFFLPWRLIEMFVFLVLLYFYGIQVLRVTLLTDTFNWTKIFYYIGPLSFKLLYCFRW